MSQIGSFEAFEQAIDDAFDHREELEDAGDPATREDAARKLDHSLEVLKDRADAVRQELVEKYLNPQAD